MATAVLMRPLDDRVVVQPNEPAKCTPGGIVLPDAAKDKPTRGIVLAIGPGKLLENGERAAMTVSEGDEVVYGRYSGVEVEIQDETVTVLRECDILGIV